MVNMYVSLCGACSREIAFDSYSTFGSCSSEPEQLRSVDLNDLEN
jgi:hypothetical protein